MMRKFKLAPIDFALFKTTIAVRIDDVNYGNHLGHDRIITMLHEARLRFLTRHGFASELDIAGAGILVTELVVNYKSEAFYGDSLTISLAIDDVSQTSFRMLYQIAQEKLAQEVARAATLISFFDYQSKKIVKIPSGFLSFITSLVKPA